MNNPVLRLHDGYRHTSPELQPDVRELQTLVGGELVADGYFGRDTDTAVQQYQACNGLVPDGIVGPLTWARLEGVEPGKPVQFWTSYSPENRALALDNKTAQQYHSSIRAAALYAGVPAAIVVAIGSRESHWGRALSPSGPYGTGDRIKRQRPRPWRDGSLPDDGKGFGRGIMQIDYDAHEFARTGPWHVPAKNIEYAGKVLAHDMLFFQRQDVRATQVLQLAVAAYNCGAGNVRRAYEAGRDVDFYTSHRDYSKNVLDRAGWFYAAGWI